MAWGGGGGGGGEREREVGREDGWEEVHGGREQSNDKGEDSQQLYNH